MKKGETKYTDLYVIRELKSFLRKLASNKDIMYMGELYENKKYSRDFLNDQVNHYKDNETIKELNRKIKNKLETRAVKYGLGLGTGNAGKTNAAFFIFFMKNAFGWKDTTTNDHNINLPIPILGTPEQLRDKIKQSPKKYIKAGTTYSEQDSDITENSDTSPDRVGDKQAITQ